MQARKEDTVRGDNRRHAIWLLFFVSLSVRLLAWWPVAANSVQPRYDEAVYFSRATGFANAIHSLARGESPRDDDLERAYANAIRPPLQSLVLALGLTVGGTHAWVARLVVVLLSSLTSVLVYRFTERLSTARAAWWAAWIHILSPSFVAYSHYLWSESTFILFMLLGLTAATRIPERDRSGALRSASVAGLWLGLAAMTRVSAYPMVIGISAWALVVQRFRRVAWLSTALLLGVAVLPMLPWQAALLEREPHPVFASTANGYNLALGNNPWIPEGLGSTWGLNVSRTGVRQSILAYARRHDVDLNRAGAALAAAHVRDNPVDAVKRALERLHMVWSFDCFPLRHFAQAVYPPGPSWMLVTVFLLSLLALLAVGSLVIHGMLASQTLRHRSLILSVIGMGMLPPLLTLGMSRIHVPLLAMALPAAGAACAEWKQPVRARRRWATGMACAAFTLLVLSSLRLAANFYLSPTSYYAPLARGVDRIANTQITLSDRIAFRASAPASFGKTLFFKPVGRGWRFHPATGPRPTWSVTPDTSRQRVDLVAPASAAELRIRLVSGSDGRVAVIQPVSRDAWMHWQPTGIPGIEFRWEGVVRPGDFLMLRRMQHRRPGRR